LIKTLGHPEDDATNTFTARLLLLLESQALLGKKVYDGIVEDVLKGYWKDYSDNRNSFIPGFLANDILRLWRTLCINYEVRTKNDTPDEKASRKVKNFKLKHSRTMTCYSTILYLLHVYNLKKTVSLEDALPMVSLTPTKRLEWLLEQDISSTASAELSTLLKQYSWFLGVSNKKPSEMVAFFKSKDFSPVRKRQYEFGDTMYRALNALGKDSLFHRIIVV